MAGPAITEDLVSDFYVFLRDYGFDYEQSLLSLNGATPEASEVFLDFYRPLIIFLWNTALAYNHPKKQADAIYNAFLDRLKKSLKEQGRQPMYTRLLQGVAYFSEACKDDHGIVHTAIRCVEMAVGEDENKNERVVALTKHILTILQYFTEITGKEGFKPFVPGDPETWVSQEPEAAPEPEAPAPEAAGPAGFHEYVDGVSGLPWATHVEEMNRDDLTFLRKSPKTNADIYVKDGCYYIFSDDRFVQFNRRVEDQAEFDQLVQVINQNFTYTREKDGARFFFRGNVVVKLDPERQEMFVQYRKDDSSATKAAAAATAPPQGQQEGTEIRFADGKVDPAVNEFIRKYYQTKEANNWIAEYISYYDEEVEYGAKGHVDKRFVANKMLEFQRAWPSRKYMLIRDVVVKDTEAPERKKISVVCEFLLENAAGKVSGKSQTEFLVRMDTDPPRIVAEKETVLEKKAVGQI